MDIIKKLFTTYYDHFCPPLWIIDFHFNKKVLEKVVCYYDDCYLESDVKMLLTYREPTNIDTNKLYYKDKLFEAFGYTESIYNIESPNIAVYCYTPCKLWNQLKDIHVMNVIGLALDSREQIDYKCLKNISNCYKRIEFYKFKVAKIFNKILQCICEHTFINHLVLHGFGVGVFSRLAKELEIDSIGIFHECLIDFITKLSDLKQNEFFKITLNFISTNFKSDCIIIDEIRVPIDILLKSCSDDILDSTLFINAWDPFSFVGNGNETDQSLDGHFGRLTAMSVLCWPIFNKYITYQSVN